METLEFNWLKRLTNSFSSKIKSAVRTASSSASSEKVEVDTSGNILIHHSRNTAQKQWAETQVLTLSGVSRVSRLILNTFFVFQLFCLLLGHIKILTRYFLELFLEI